MDIPITIGHIVSADYRTSRIFEKYGIDFCCRGDRLLKEVCLEKGIAEDTLHLELDSILTQPGPGTLNGPTMDPGELATFIEQTHHHYIRENMPLISQNLEKIQRVHGKNHPELEEIGKLFFESVGELNVHMKKEELILFPFIRKLMEMKKNRLPWQELPFGKMENPIASMRNDHDQEGDRFARIRALSQDYSLPIDGCTTYRLTYELLKAFEQDLHRHIHLENNQLFPEAILLEQACRTGQWPEDHTEPISGL